ncbi:serine hydrolase domain-containing protein [Niveibacterium umoris]|uniref:D-alanyl-D-alanine carboxypeptidase n=1 Tax=Niveibacterium umoris TaxID=1193620 RepID=A0A840BR06_9RHOO|nr:serine hydrolase domain-containing protein [Niveibacterium umoris]MBB4014102.1 D-alanyl-D-alanine carboxypeptidase [Niveibacterium umoris]
MPHALIACSHTFTRSLARACALVAAFGCGLALPAGASAQTALKRIDTVAFQRTVQALAKEMLVPGVVVLLRTPRGNFDYRYGTSALGGMERVTTSQHIRVGSNTKTWVGTVILQQASEGLLRLDDPIAKYLPDVPNGERIKIEHLLNMRSGLFNYSETLELNETLDREPGKSWKPDELLAIAFRHKPNTYFEPDTDFHYSNTNTVLLGLLAEKLEHGKPLSQILQDRLFKPLGLKDTLFPDTRDNTLPTPYARGYMYGDNVSTMPPHQALPQDAQDNARRGALLPTEQTTVNPSWGWAAGAGISTADDLLVWVRALVEGKLLPPAMQKARLDSVRPIQGGAQYGQAIARFGPLYGHTGELPGYNSFMGHDPQNKVTLIVWTNLAPSMTGKDPATTIAKAVIEQLYPAAKPPAP